MTQKNKTPQHSSPKTSSEKSKQIDPKEILRSIESLGAVAELAEGDAARPIFGTTLFIASCPVDTRFGEFTAFVFQDLIHKGYIVALAKGDIQEAEQLYTRIHSSCVTSETLRGCDCDCIKQLEGALQKISEKTAGVLFYLIQEGRGVGYVAKARDRMLVQAALDEISTFEAYQAMGLKKDYRNYENIKAICHLLGLTAPFVVLTNNPDKVEALKALGLTVKGVEGIDIDPGPFNLAYLTSKAASGHLIKKHSGEVPRRAIPPEAVETFNPQVVEQAGRFIFAARYFLPMKPVDGEILLIKSQIQAFERTRSLAQYQQGEQPLIVGIRASHGERVLVKIDRKNLGRYREEHPTDELVALLTSPYWFAVHVYYDIVRSQEFVVLMHGSERYERTPVVRIHSDSIFDRFPLRDVSNRDKLKQSARMIVENGYGMIVLLHDDGRGAGFGAHATDLMYRNARLSETSEETYQLLGVDYDLRDYESAMQLICHHLPDRRLEMIMSSLEGLVKKHEILLALKKFEIKVERWHFLES